MNALDMSARYTVAGYRGVAFYLTGYATQETYPDDVLICEDDDCDHRMSELCWLYSEPETVEDTETVIAVMVGDDREHLVSVDDLTVIADDDYCSECGQTGCTADGRAL